MTLKDTKHWSTKSDAARDEVKDALEEAVDWVLAHRREAGTAAAAIAVLALIVGVFLYQRRARADEAWDKLAQAELYAYSGRPQEAQTLLAQVAEGGGSAAATTLARMLDGDLRAPRAEFDQAIADFDKAVQEAPEALRPYALADKVLTLEAAGKGAECAAAAQSFLDATPDHLLAPQVHAGLARCQALQGRNEEAKATLQRVALQYPNTSWSAWANAALQAPAKPAK